MNHEKRLAIIATSFLAIACSDNNTGSTSTDTPGASMPSALTEEGDVSLMIGETTYQYPVIACQVRGDQALVQASEGMSGYAFQTDVTQTRVSFQREWVEDGSTMHEQWDVRRPSYTIDGSTITVSDTIQRTGLWKVLDSGRERVQGAERIELPFTLTASCRG